MTSPNPAPPLLVRPRTALGRAAVITGSTSGIGLGIATACASAGYDVMLNGFGDRAEIDELCTQLEREHGVSVAYGPADLSRADEVGPLIEAATKNFGKIDLLVNNAGFFRVESLESTSTSDWNRTIAINMTAVFHTIRAVLPGMRRRKSGRIVNIASALGTVGQIGCSAYAATKHGVIGLTKCAALEAAGDRITVNAICPGYVRTNHVAAEIRAMAAARGISEAAAAAEIVAAAHPTMQYVTPAQIGDLVVFLASEHGASITGAALAVDGGWTAR